MKKKVYRELYNETKEETKEETIVIPKVKKIKVKKGDK